MIMLDFRTHLSGTPRALGLDSVDGIDRLRSLDSRMIVLLPVDGSPSSTQALRLVAAYRGERSSLEPLLVNVQRRPVSLWPQPALDARAVDAVLHEQGLGVLAPARAALAEAGFAVRAEVRISIPAQALLDEAAHRGAGLIVMGTRGIGGLAALGSVATRVVHGAQVPVMLVRQDARLPAEFGLRQRVLLAVDGSGHALAAARWLAARPRWLGEASVDLVHAQEPLPLIAAMLPPHGDVLDQWSGRHSRELSRPAGEVLADAGIAHELHAATGEPARTLARLADELRADLVVMGTRGMGAAHHAFIGSVALGTAQLSPVPVLLIP